MALRRFGKVVEGVVEGGGVAALGAEGGSIVRSIVGEFADRAFWGAELDSILPINITILPYKKIVRTRKANDNRYEQVSLIFPLKMAWTAGNILISANILMSGILIAGSDCIAILGDMGQPIM